MTHASNPANSALLAQSWEISVSEKVRGGAERTRTPCQARSSIEPVSVTAPMLQAWRASVTCRLNGPANTRCLACLRNSSHSNRVSACAVSVAGKRDCRPGGQARDEAASDRIDRQYEHDWNGTARLL